jgi:prevent-host-death family protein
VYTIVDTNETPWQNRFEMKTTTIREFRKDVSELLRGKDAVLVTRHGRPAGVLYPLTDPRKLPMKVRRKLYLELSEGIARQLETKGITEEQLQRDFKDFKKRRRRQ